MKLKKTTRVLFCQLPKGASSTTLKRSSGAKLKDIDISEIFEDSIANSYLPYILFQLGMLNTVNILDVYGNEKQAYVVPCRKKFCDIDPTEIRRVVMQNAETHDEDKIGELVTTIIGIQYVLHSKKQFEIDVVLIEGNSPSDIENELIESGKLTNNKHRAAKSRT